MYFVASPCCFQLMLRSSFACDLSFPFFVPSDGPHETKRGGDEGSVPAGGHSDTIAKELAPAVASIQTQVKHTHVD